MKSKKIVIVRGGGDIATGAIQKLHRSGFCVLVLEVEKPTAIRRNVSLCEAVYDGHATVEDIVCHKIHTLDEAEDCWKNDSVPLLVDPLGECIKKIKPNCVIDAILAKRNLGTNLTMAPITIGLGPGFIAFHDVNVVIETMRGHNLGRLYFEGSALPNTGIPGEIGGKSEQRVIRAPVKGIVKSKVNIGEIVKEGSVILTVDNIPVISPFTGLLRGLIRPNLSVSCGMKIADIDPRLDTDWHTISDKARSIGGAALEAFLYFSNKH